MSNGSEAFSVWVGDLDSYVSLSAIEAANDLEDAAKALEHELDSIGEIKLLSSKAITARILSERGITPAEWRWARHEADRALMSVDQDNALERHFLKALLSIGKPYAISRYSKWENIPYASALTAALPHGMRALLEQFLLGEGIALTSSDKKWLASVLKDAQVKTGSVAYDRAGLIKAAIQKFADRNSIRVNSAPLKKDSTRVILSLARLHFSVSEIMFGSFAEVGELFKRYEISRSQALKEDSGSVSSDARRIPRWSLRFRHPLTFLLPFTQRHTLARVVEHESKAYETDRTVLLNELALAHCGVLLMRRDARASKKT